MSAIDRSGLMTLMQALHHENNRTQAQCHNHCKDNQAFRLQDHLIAALRHFPVKLDSSSVCFVPLAARSAHRSTSPTPRRTATCTNTARSATSNHLSSHRPIPVSHWILLKARARRRCSLSTLHSDDRGRVPTCGLLTRHCDARVPSPTCATLLSNRHRQQPLPVSLPKSLLPLCRVIRSCERIQVNLGLRRARVIQTRSRRLTRVRVAMRAATLLRTMPACRPPTHANR